MYPYYVFMRIFLTHIHTQQEEKLLPSCVWVLVKSVNGLYQKFKCSWRGINPKRKKDQSECKLRIFLSPQQKSNTNHDKRWRGKDWTHTKKWAGKNGSMITYTTLRNYHIAFSNETPQLPTEHGVHLTTTFRNGNAWERNAEEKGWKKGNRTNPFHLSQKFF